jgi:hypothetical protein
VPAVLVAAATVPVVVAQTGGLDVGTLLASYGAATPFALVLLYWLRSTEARATRWEAAYLALAEKTADEVVPVLAESQRIHQEAAELATRQTVMLHQLHARPQPDPALLMEAERSLRDTIRRAGS